MQRPFRVGPLLIAVALGVLAVVGVPAPQARAIPVAASAYHGLVPARVADTREGAVTVDGLVAGVGAVAAGSVLDVPVVGRGGVPVSGVGAVAVNVAVTSPSAGSYLTLFPSGSVRPLASNVNMEAGQTVSNMAVVKVGSNGSISVFNNSGSTEVVVDVLGWFPATASGGATLLASPGQAGAPANGYSIDPAISGDGRFVAFTSEATNLVVGDTNNADDIFRFDTLTAARTRVSITAGGAQPNGDSSHPSISADGTVVAFASEATNLVAGDVNGYTDIFVRDVDAGTTSRVSVAVGGAQANLDSERPDVSGDGRFVVFTSSATNLVAGDTNASADVFVYSRATGLVTRVSRSSAGVQGNGASRNARISGDGRYVVFESAATNLVAGDTNTADDVFVHDRVAGSTVRASITSVGSQVGVNAVQPDISDDGRTVVFVSGAQAAPNSTPNSDNVFVRDLVAGTTVTVSVDRTGAPGNGEASSPSLSADGRRVTFESTSTDLVSIDLNGTVLDVYVRDLDLGATGLVSRGVFGQQPSLAAHDAVISADGRHVAFRAVGDLDPCDTNNLIDVYRRDLGTV